MGIDALNVIHDYVAYDAGTGIFTWKKSPPSRRKHVVGTRADKPENCGTKIYHYVYFGGKKWRAHRLAWFLTYGEFPDFIDHIDEDGTNNRLSNLRQATKAQNNHNTSSRKLGSTQLRGVTEDIHRRKFQARISVNNKTIHLGRFNTADEAHEAYKTAAIKYFGEFARFE